MAIRLPRFLRSIPIAEGNGTPSPAFHQWWDTTLKQIEKSISDIEFALTVAGVALGTATQALRINSRAVTTSTSATTDDYLILANATSASITVTLPVAADSDGTVIVVKKTDSSSNTVVVDGNGSETIDGATTQTLTSQYDSISVACDGAVWWIV